MLQVLAPWLTSSAAAEGPERSPPRHRDRRSPSPPRRRHENFHHVAPPKRLRTARAFLTPLSANMETQEMFLLASVLKKLP